MTIYDTIRMQSIEEKRYISVEREKRIYHVVDLLGVHVNVDGTVCDDTSEHVKDGPVLVDIDIERVGDCGRLCGWRLDLQSRQHVGRNRR